MMKENGGIARRIHHDMADQERHVAVAAEVAADIETGVGGVLRRNHAHAQDQNHPVIVAKDIHHARDATHATI